MPWLRPGTSGAAEPLSPEEVKRLLDEAPIAHEGAMLALATYRISYHFKSEALEGCKTYHEGMLARSEFLRGPMIIPRGGRRIFPEESIPHEFACELLGTTDAHKLTYRCLLENSYDKLPLGTLSVQIRTGENHADYLATGKRARSLAPNYLSLLNHLPTDIPYMLSPGQWGTHRDQSISALLAKVKAAPSMYKASASRDKDIILLKIIQTLQGPWVTVAGAGLLWKIELDAGKNFAPLFVAEIPGRDVDGAFKEYGHSDSITFSSHVEPSPGIWMPKEIVAIHKGRLNDFVTAGENVAAWNKTNLPLESPLRISCYAIKVTSIEVNGVVEDKEMILQEQQGGKAR